jgi:hypothetical protein
MTPQPEYIFGWFSRQKYQDLVFYHKDGEYSNLELFEMPDTEQNRELMIALSRPHTLTSEIFNQKVVDQMLLWAREDERRSATLAAYREVMNKIEYRFGDTESGRRTIETCLKIITALLQQQVHP